MFTFALSASSAPLRESILHAEAQRTQRLCTKTKAVRVARRRDTSRLEPQSNPRLRDLRIGCEDKGIAIRADIHRRA